MLKRTKPLLQCVCVCVACNKRNYIVVLSNVANNDINRMLVTRPTNNKIVSQFVYLFSVRLKLSRETLFPPSCRPLHFIICHWIRLSYFFASFFSRRPSAPTRYIHHSCYLFIHMLLQRVCVCLDTIFHFMM